MFNHQDWDLPSPTHEIKTNRRLPVVLTKGVVAIALQGPKIKGFRADQGSTQGSKREN